MLVLCLLDAMALAVAGRSFCRDSETVGKNQETEATRPVVAAWEHESLRESLRHQSAPRPNYQIIYQHRRGTFSAAAFFFCPFRWTRYSAADATATCTFSRASSWQLTKGCLPAGTMVVQVAATDADDPTYGNSARVVYSIVHGQPYFSVEPKTGGCTQAPLHCPLQASCSTPASILRS